MKILVVDVCVTIFILTYYCHHHRSTSPLRHIFRTILLGFLPLLIPFFSLFTVRNLHQQSSPSLEVQRFYHPNICGFISRNANLELMFYPVIVDPKDMS